MRFVAHTFWRSRYARCWRVFGLCAFEKYVAQMRIVFVFQRFGKLPYPLDFKWFVLWDKMCSRYAISLRYFSAVFLDTLA